jgi:hypothetical protein
VVGDSVVIGIENGDAVPGTFQRAACIAATTAFNPRTVGDTSSVSVAAPPGMTISRVQYVQLGNRLLERSTYWQASGSGELTAADVSVPFSFTTPGLGRSIDLAGRNVDSTTISVSISMSAGRSNNHPRVTDPPWIGVHLGNERHDHRRVRLNGPSPNSHPASAPDAGCCEMVVAVHGHSRHCTSMHRCRGRSSRSLTLVS